MDGDPALVIMDGDPALVIMDGDPALVIMDASECSQTSVPFLVGKPAGYTNPFKTTEKHPIHCEVYRKW